LTLDGDWYGLSVVGPTERIRQHRDSHAALLVDAKVRLLAEQGPTLLQVHHDQPTGTSPVATVVEPARVAGVPGFWLDLGQPSFGPEAVAAIGVEAVTLNGRELSRVAPLQALD
ncbi:hypothetical protein SB751_28795, partial [Cupriavidus sp. SIMBA_020]